MSSNSHLHNRIQEKGLPHAYILLRLENGREHRDAKFIDNMILVEIPEKEREPELYEVVSRFMVHGQCGNVVKHAPCVSKCICTKKFPQAFHAGTTLDENGYVVYRRRDNDK